MSDENDTTHRVAGVGLPAGGPFAFPFHVAIPRPDGNGTVYATASGMELRDWFAGQFFAARLANPNGNQGLTDADMAKFAYERADAMMRARNWK
jgi:hypothetical protein